MHVIKLLHALHGHYMIYMLLQSGMFHYMLEQLHAYYMILHAFTIDSMQLQALHANPVGPRDFEIPLGFRNHTLGGFSTSFAGLCYQLTALFHAANMLNTHEDLRSRPATWMVSGFVPHVDPEAQGRRKLCKCSQRGTHGTVLRLSV